ncbi:hypothetical protein PSAB6_340063 [Paraburkholderia sabiae]|nr:hypothetical protein PSAB6_340063 [Paraburkholderia sabiae]
MNSFYITTAVIVCVSILYVLWNEKGLREERERARPQDDKRKAQLARQEPTQSTGQTTADGRPLPDAVSTRVPPSA